MVRAQRHARLDEAPRAEILMPFAQHPMGSLAIVVRTRLRQKRSSSRQARDLEHRSAADVLSNSDARRAGGAHANHSSVRPDRADGSPPWRFCSRPQGCTAS